MSKDGALTLNRSKSYFHFVCFDCSHMFHLNSCIVCVYVCHYPYSTIYAFDWCGLFAVFVVHLRKEKYFLSIYSIPKIDCEEKEPCGERLNRFIDD